LGDIPSFTVALLICPVEDTVTTTVGVPLVGTKQAAEVALAGAVLLVNNDRMALAGRYA
jgi:hypothetical protein